MEQTSLEFNNLAEAQGETKRYPARPSPFCLRLSNAEREILEKAAGKRPLGPFIISQALKSLGITQAVTKRRKTRKNPDEENKIIGQILAEFGKSHLHQNIAQLLLATQNSPELFTAELCMVIESARHDVQTIREVLLKARGTRASCNIPALKKLLKRLKNPYLSRNLNRIVKTIHIGAFVLSPEVHSMILEVCAEIDAIRSMLMQALGLAG